MIFRIFDRIQVENLKIRRFESKNFFDIVKIERENERRSLALSAQVSAARFSSNEREHERHFSFEDSYSANKCQQPSTF